MDENIDDFAVCNDNWEKLNELQDLGSHLNNIQQWFEADAVPKPDVLEAIHEVAKYAGLLTQRLIDLQIKLLTNL